eukprot:scaffold207776_cov32-Tisochrysis_lutea.AAC.8
MAKRRCSTHRHVGAGVATSRSLRYDVGPKKGGSGLGAMPLSCYCLLFPWRGRELERELKVEFE